MANKEANLYFALIGGFKDSKGPNTLIDHPILKLANEGIDALNERYALDGTNIFYFYHRKNVLNEIDQSWTGWERKRGALMEFNDLLLGSKDTSFIYHENNHLIHAQIKYIITLDADTVLPLGMAKKMIGTMAHPLNLPVIDEERKVVVEGHGLMQPRISFDMDSSNKSIFSRIYTGQEGMDPYASAISDVYQDLFDEGIFTGKGIYDLKVFRDILQNVVPENAVLSHDLLEGSYVRAALVSDLELVDSYPTKYNAYVARLHRWIRGDWQLIPWLSRTVVNKSKEIITNPLSYISLWKIADNLRRSLVAPSLMLLIVLGMSLLPGSVYFWMGCVAVVICLPLIINVVEQITGDGLKMRKTKRHISGFFGLKASLFQLLLTTIFLSFQAAMIINAISITLVRVLITKKKMLEWVTSDDAEKMQSSSLKSYISSMGISSLFGLPIVALTYVFKPESLGFSLIFLILWGIAPFVAYYISKNKDTIKEVLSAEELKDLRQTARKTWRYFEEFANEKNNHLAPDNYQEEPYRGIAYRTSPTNIGLGLMATLTARDFGYIGLEEMVNKLDKTLITIEKMDKWHGHLYNWYDTRSLEPLKPRYISTVDSGNFVCYLMTLRQGLKEYYKRPLMDEAFVRGIQDTIACGLEENASFPEAFSGLEQMGDAETLSLVSWNKNISKLLMSSDLEQVNIKPWKYKTERMLKAYMSEVATFMPWVELLDAIPKALYFNTNNFKGTEFIELLDKNIAWNALTAHCRVISEKAEGIMEELKGATETEFLELGTWMQELMVRVGSAQGTIAKFINRYEQLIQRVDQLSEATRFAPLYEEKRQLFSIGFNLEDNRLSNSYYDLLASEARQTSYIAIARGEVPVKHWYMLGRSLTIVDRYKGLVSWSGTMFEYLMPLLLMRSYKNTLLDETYSFVIKSQKKYGKERNMPWGASESAFSVLDINLDYQYKAIGVPWLGLKRGLIDDAVVAPYASFLALLVSPLDSYKNIVHLKKEGLEGSYGYYEAADYTPERMEPNQEKIIIKSYMAHHQGMSLLALNNYLNTSNMQYRFARDPYVKAARLLLQEKVPTNVVFTKENKEKIIPFKGYVYRDGGSYREFHEPNVILPKAHVLSNGYYSLVTTDKGTGYSRTKHYAINRWREEAILDRHGMFFYIKNKETNETWS
ncbi:MAG: glycosyl transferase, partial [Vallitaleaceae bacterium]|nr:glycosyl transferase [Vallitaleaceae bacterium]